MFADITKRWKPLNIHEHYELSQLLPKMLTSIKQAFMFMTMITPSFSLILYNSWIVWHKSVGLCVCAQMSRCTAVKTVMSCSPQRLSCGGIRSIHAPAPVRSLTHWEKTSNKNVRTATSPSTSVKTVKRSSQMSTGTQTHAFYNTLVLIKMYAFNIYSPLIWMH